MISKDTFAYPIYEKMHEKRTPNYDKIPYTPRLKQTQIKQQTITYPPSLGNTLPPRVYSIYLP